MGHVPRHYFTIRVIGSLSHSLAKKGFPPTPAMAVPAQPLYRYFKSPVIELKSCSRKSDDPASAIPISFLNRFHLKREAVDTWSGWP